jgi:hypothetical protein
MGVDPVVQRVEEHRRDYRIGTWFLVSQRCFGAISFMIANCSLGSVESHLISSRPCRAYTTVTDNFYVSAKNLPFQNCRYLQLIYTFRLTKKVVISAMYL